jgi:hypothetical protein
MFFTVLRTKTAVKLDNVFFSSHRISLFSPRSNHFLFFSAGLVAIIDHWTSLQNIPYRGTETRLLQPYGIDSLEIP